MAGRLAGRGTPRRFGTARGGGLMATALLAIILTLPMASAAPTSRNAAEGKADGPAVAAPAAEVQPDPVQDGSMPALRTALGRRQASAVETHIETLHRTLHVTPMQEPLWQPLARAMRSNIAELDGAYARRKGLHGSMSAVDDLKSYGVVQQIHARNVQTLIGPFEALYDSFSPSQKKEADDTFRGFTDNAIKNSR